MILTGQGAHFHKTCQTNSRYLFSHLHLKRYQEINYSLEMVSNYGLSTEYESFLMTYI